MANDTQWIETVADAAAAGERLVVVTVAGASGSTPREPGAKMIVWAASTEGTIGGGQLEHQSIALARSVIEAGGGAMLRRFPLAAALGQCCGGVIELLFEPVDGAATWPAAVRCALRGGTPFVIATVLQAGVSEGKLIVRDDERIGTLGIAAVDDIAAAHAARMIAKREPARRLRIEARECRCEVLLEPVGSAQAPLLLFGAGHVGRAVVATLAPTGQTIIWVDERAAEFPAQVMPNVTVAVSDAPLAEIDDAPAGALYLVMTHSHALDERLAEAILRRGDFAYFGLIGSLTKRRRFETRLAARGLETGVFDRMACPIGIDGIDGKRPQEIAIAVAAQLLRCRGQIEAANEEARKKADPARALRATGAR